MWSVPFIIAFIAIAFPAAGDVTCELPGVTARVDPEIAAPGEPIVVTLCNNSSSTVNLPSSCVFNGVYSAIGGLFYTPFCPQIITPILPGQSLSQSWDQRGNGGEQAPNGQYFIFISGFSVFDFVVVTIADAVPALTRWGLSALIGVSALAGLSAVRIRSRSRS